MSTDFRALCADLLRELEHASAWDYQQALKDQARAALAEPVGEGPTDEELLETARTVDLLMEDGSTGYLDFADVSHLVVGFARAVLARFGHQPTPPAAGEVGELVAWLRGANWDGKRQSLATRAADLLERQAVPVLEPALARINDILNDSGRILQTDELEALELARQALEQRHPAPVPVAERLQQLQDLAADAVSGLRYIEQTHGRLYGVGWDRVYEKADRLQPGHALPLPAGEVE